MLGGAGTLPLRCRILSTGQHAQRVFQTLRITQHLIRLQEERVRSSKGSRRPPPSRPPRPTWETFCMHRSTS